MDFIYLWKYLEQTRELAVPVGDVGGLAVDQGGDHVTQRRQAEVGSQK